MHSDHPTLQTILTRRSVRQFRPEQLREEHLADILEAGRHAPSGGNSQTTHFLVLQKPEVLSALVKMVSATFAQMETDEHTYRSLRNSIRLSKQGGYVFTFGAPTLVVVANRRDYGNAMADSAVALENMMLAATALGIGSCWINQLHWLDESFAIRTYLERLGLSHLETICGAVALGYSDSIPDKPLARNGNPVTYVR